MGSIPVHSACVLGALAIVGVALSQQARIAAWWDRADADAASEIVPDQPVIPVFEAVAYYQESCARCHGEYGELWSEGFIHVSGAEAVAQHTASMVEMHGMRELDGGDLATLTAYVRSLGERRVFVSVTGSGEEIRGEVTPGAEVAVVGLKDGAEVRVVARVEGHAWSVRLPEGVAGRRVEATLGGQTVRVGLAGKVVGTSNEAGK